VPGLPVRRRRSGPSQLIPEVDSVGNPANLNSTLKNENASQKAIAANG
jgi:hypothetical protein